MWQNYIKPILKTNLVALFWSLLVGIPLFFSSITVLDYIYGPEIVDSIEFTSTIPYIIFQLVLSVTLSVFVNYKSTVFLFKQKTINKIKLLNIFLMTYVTFSVFTLAVGDFIVASEGNETLDYILFLIDTVVVFFIAKNVFKNNGKFKLKI